MKIDLEKLNMLSKEEKEELYSCLITKKNDLLDDIMYTEMALEDKCIDYMARKEYSNDIICDKLQICEINGILKALEPYIELPKEKGKRKRK